MTERIKKLEDELKKIVGEDPVESGDCLMKSLKKKKLKDNTTYIIAQVEKESSDSE